MSTFQCLHFLANHSLGIIEIKRLDVPRDAPATDRFFWLRLDRNSGEISCLDFQSMDAATEIQERYFSQGYLKFNSNTGTYIEKFNSAQYTLDNLGSADMDHAILKAVDRYLSEIFHNP